MGKQTQTIELAREEAMERVAAAAMSRLLVLVPPYALLMVLAVLGAISHAKWGEPPAVTWATMASTLSTVTLSGLTWAVSHARNLLGRVHSTASAAGGGLWFTVATITGVGAPVTLGALFFGGLTLAVGWNIRAVIRAGGDDSGHGDPLANLFDKAKTSFGLDGSRVRTRQVNEHKIEAELALPAGKKTAGDVIKRTEYVESGMRFPAGSVVVAEDENRADRAHMTITDPRVMKRPLPWAGPYRPGGSIAEALRTGLFQDMDPVLHTIVGHHIQVMGMSGSGKSIGACWNYLAEIITRFDAVVFGADITKGDQTLGPFRPAMHRFETTKAGVRKLINDIEAEIKPRTDYLAEHGYQKWVQGCGLAYWVIWLEEVPDIIAALGEKGGEKLLRILKALRSAGGTVVMSLQRSDYSQMPTLARGQLAHMCLGVATDSDASFGLSSAQQDREARPELWANKRPGMAYLDAPSIPETHIAMPLRTYAWSAIDDDEAAADREARTNIAAHVADWPAAAKQVDEFTAKVASLPAPALTGATAAVAAPSGHALPPTLTGGDHDSDHDSDREKDVEDGLERLAAAAEHIIATQRVDLGDLGLEPTERLRILETLERKGIIGPTGAGGDREVLASADDAVTEILDDGDPVSEYMRTTDPSPDITAGPHDEIPDLPADEAALQTPDEDNSARQLTPAAARQVMHAWIRARATTKPTFTASDPGLKTVREEAGGKGRGWVYKVLGELETAGVIERTDEGFQIVVVELLDDLQSTEGVNP
jgi:hypothetical protein